MSSPTAASAGQARNDDVEETDNGANDSLEDCANAIHDGHQACTNGAENALKA